MATTGITVLITVTKEDTLRPDVLDNRRCARAVFAVLAEKYKPVVLGIAPGDFRNISALKRKIRLLKPACIFNLFEGFGVDPGKEAVFIKVLTQLGVPFTGNTFKPVLTCSDKSRAKAILARCGIRVPLGIVVKKTLPYSLEGIDFPVFVKPLAEGGSVGVDSSALAADFSRLKEVVAQKIDQFPAGLLVEEFISGNEYNVGFLGNRPYELLGVSVIDYKKYNKFKPFLTYSAKWDTQSGEYRELVPSLEEKLDKSREKRIIALSHKAGVALGCRGYFRVDLREKDGELYVLEVNPNPDINTDSGFLKQAYHKGYTYPQVIEKIVNIALL